MTLSGIQLLILSQSILGFGIAVHLISYNKQFTNKLLGLYTLLLSIVAFEPLTEVVEANAQSALQMLVAISSFLLGPALFLYCKYRISDERWRATDLIHGFPAFVIFVLLVNAQFNGLDTQNDSENEEILWYLLFVAQLFGYTIKSFLIVRSYYRRHPQQKHKLQKTFLKPLVITSLILFSYSFFNTLVPVFSKNIFLILIQILIGFLIIVIALLNDETLEKHRI
jgi:uncharacterized membrane protein